jgi:hypothetical protein
VITAIALLTGCPSNATNEAEGRIQGLCINFSAQLKAERSRLTELSSEAAKNVGVRPEDIAEFTSRKFDQIRLVADSDQFLWANDVCRPVAADRIPCINAVNDYRDQFYVYQGPVKRGEALSVADRNVLTKHFDACLKNCLGE